MHTGRVRCVPDIGRVEQAVSTEDQGARIRASRCDASDVEGALACGRRRNHGFAVTLSCSHSSTFI